MKVKKVLVSQPRPAIIEKSPFYELSEKYKVEIAYKPFIRVVGVSLKEFRAQRVEILTHTAVIFTSRTTVDSFFHICEDVSGMLAQPGKLAEMGRNARSLSVDDSLDRIADALLKLVKTP